MKRLSKRRLISSGKTPVVRRVRMSTFGQWLLSRSTIATSLKAAPRAALLANLPAPKSLLPLRNLLLPQNLLLLKNLLSKSIFGYRKFRKKFRRSRSFFFIFLTRKLSNRKRLFRPLDAGRNLQKSGHGIRLFS